MLSRGLDGQRTPFQMFLQLLVKEVEKSDSSLDLSFLEQICSLVHTVIQIFIAFKLFEQGLIDLDRCI